MNDGEGAGIEPAHGGLSAVTSGSQPATLPTRSSLHRAGGPSHPPVRFISNIVIGPGFFPSKFTLLPPPFCLNCRPERRERDADRSGDTWPHRIARRRDFLETGHCVQASTSRSPFAGRCLFAHRWQAIRSVKTFGVMTKTRPDRSQPWKCFSSLMCEM